MKKPPAANLTVGCVQNLVLELEIRPRTEVFRSHHNRYRVINRKHWRIQGGAPGTRAPPWGSKFFHFHAVFGKNNK